ncbi:hypothetical protein ACF09J_25060 [Streptomyces sp. NPDC014889]|uniref:hypothetical protein n=1 Tax=Streptomyces sp. NPDC014889 TaxID=3364928 RepID=UPI0037015A5E
MWATWLATYFLVFSAGSVGGHTYYMGVIAVPLAALTGGGVALMWRAYRAGGPRAWALPGAVAATAAWSAYLAHEFPSFLPWLAPAVGLLGLGAVVLLVLGGRGRSGSGGRLALAGLSASLAALLFAPSAWAVQVFNPAYASSGRGAVGPSGKHRGHRSVTPAGGRTGQRPRTSAGSHGETPGAPGSTGGFGGLRDDGRLTVAQRELLRYTAAHRGSATYVFATTDWKGASPYILATGARVLPLGGYSGGVPFPTETQFRQMVASGKLRYVLLGSAGRSRGALSGNRTGTGATQVTAWVQAACTPVPASAYGGTEPVGAAQPSVATGEKLYRCAPGAV